jgi:hypothetical protein
MRHFDYLRPFVSCAWLRFASLNWPILIQHFRFPDKLSRAANGCSLSSQSLKPELFFIAGARLAHLITDIKGVLTDGEFLPDRIGLEYHFQFGLSVSDEHGSRGYYLTVTA